MADFKIRQNDRKYWYFALKHAYDKSAYDVSDSSIAITVKCRAQGDDDSLWEATCEKIHPSYGVVRFLIPASGFDEDAGRYELEFTMTTSGLPETAQNILTVRLVEEFGAVA